MKDFDTGLMIGAIITVCVGIILFVCWNSIWRFEAIKNNAAQYNPTNGLFEWKTNCPCVVTNK